MDDKKRIRSMSESDLLHFWKITPSWFAYGDELKLKPGLYTKDNINENDFLPYLILAIQQCHKEIKGLNKRIEKLEKQIKKSGD